MAGLITKLAAKVADTSPYAVILSWSCVMSATYANITEKVTAKIPDIEITAKYHHGLVLINGIGTHVKNTVSKRNDLLPHTSDKAPISGALMNDKKPFTP